MTAKFKRKQSKRKTCHLKYKIEKKVRQHNKKCRRESKKNPKANRKQKPFIPPNAELWAELTKKEEIIRQQNAEKLQQFENSELGMQSRKEAERYMEEYEASKSHDVRATKIHREEFNTILEESDIVIQVLDARDPFGTRSKLVEQAVLEKNPQKRLLFLLNKIDLVPTKTVCQWVEYLKTEVPTLPFKSSLELPTVKKSRKTKDYKVETSVGPLLLEKMLNKYKTDQNIITPITIGIVGSSKVGKSSVINSIVERFINAKEVKDPSKNIKIVELTSDLRIICSPALIKDETTPEPNLMLRNCNNSVQRAEIVFSKMSKEDISSYYKVFGFQNSQELFEILAKNIRCFTEEGEPDVVAGASRLEKDWLNGRIKFFTSPEDVERHSIPSEIASQNRLNFTEPDEKKVWGGINSFCKLSTSKHICIKAQLPIKEEQNWVTLEEKMEEE